MIFVIARRGDRQPLCLDGLLVRRSQTQKGDRSDWLFWLTVAKHGTLGQAWLPQIPGAAILHCYRMKIREREGQRTQGLDLVRVYLTGWGNILLSVISSAGITGVHEEKRAFRTVPYPSTGAGGGG